MAISFNGIPTTLRVPFVFVEFDNSRAQQGPAIQKYTTLVLGQKLAAGSATPLTLDTITSEAQARQLYGEGSMIWGMLKRYLDNDKVTELVAMSLDDDGAAVAATGSFDLTGTATESGTLAVYIAGKKVAVAVSENDTDTTVAANLASAINADGELYVTAAVNGVDNTVVDVTAKNKGEAGNEIDLSVNLFSSDKTPAGLSVAITSMSGGTTNPDLSAAIAALPETQYNVIVHAYTDAANLTVLETELADRFGPIRQNDGVAFSAKIDTLSGLTTLGNSRNSPHSSIMGAQGPSAPWEWAAAYGAQVAKNGQADPARPFQTLPLIGIVAPKETERFTLSERNNLLFDGIATHTVADGGIVRIERAITTWQTNAAGAPDSSFLDVNTLLTLSFLRFSFRNRILSKYARHKLADSGTRFGPGQKVITPQLGKAEAVALFAEWEEAGLVEGLEQFKRDLIVERNAQDRNRLDFLLPADLINQLRVVGAQIQFLL